jgi:LSD1 subclass zinc finger protein
MTTTFKCSSCGAPLTYENDGAPTVRCPYCSNTVIVPEEVVRASQQPGAAASQVPAENPAPDPADLFKNPASRADLREKLHEMRHEAREERHEIRREARRLRRDE